MNSKWNKLIIGAILLIGFVLYTQYEKSAEPTWKVDAENFQVINDWEELMELEEKKYYELKFANRFELLKNSNKSIPLSTENRSIRIEKTWNHGFQLYILYSVDLTERDKAEDQVPRLIVDRVKLTAKDGKEYEMKAEVNEGEIITNGYVYKHRLYRSMMIYPNTEELNDQNTWENMMTSNKFEITKASMVSNKSRIDLKTIAFKVTPYKLNEQPETLAAIPVNKSIMFYNGDKMVVKELQYYPIGSRLSIDRILDDNVIAFSGEISKNASNGTTLPGVYEIFKDSKNNSYIETYSIMDQLLMMDPKDTSEFTLSHSILLTEGEYEFVVTKNEIEEITQNPQKEIPKNKTLVDENGVKAVYLGLGADQNNQPSIKFTIENAGNPLDHYFLDPRPSYHFKDWDMELNKHYTSNLVTVKNGKGKQLEDYHISNMSNGENTEYFISFHNINGIPKEDLTISLSNLTRIEPLKNKIKIPIKFPDRKQTKK